MKNLFTFAFTASFMLGVSTVSAQTEYTVIRNIPLTNADFTADAPLSGIERIYTYDRDMPDAGAGADGIGRFGLQPITGWTANIPSDNIKTPDRTDGANAKAAGIFTYNDENSGELTGVGLGGTFYAPYAPEGSTQGLGLVSVWSSEASYTQDVSLTPGAYKLTAILQNTAGAADITNRFGFIASDTESYMSTTKNYPAGADQWIEDVVIFKIDKAVNGKVSIGYVAGDAGSAKCPHIFYDKITLEEIDPAPLYKAEVDKLKETLAEVIEQAEFYGVSTKAATDVYNDENATLEDVQNAIDALKVSIKNDRKDLSAFFFRNAHFDEDEAIPEDNGICTYDYDKEKNNVNYSGMQEISSWVASNPGENGRAAGIFSVGSNSFLGGKDFVGPKDLSNGKTEGKVLGFVSCWGGVASYTQSVSLPKGKYTLEISYYNSENSKEEVDIAKNLMGFVSNEGVEHYGKTVSFPGGKWTTETIQFELTEETAGNFSMGYQAAGTGSDVQPHLFIDGISLYYSGEMDIDPSLFALQASVKSAKGYESEYFNTELQSQLNELVSKGDDLIADNSSDAEVNTATAQAINDLLPIVKANVKAYEDLATFKDETLAAADEKYAEVSQVSGKLTDLIDAAEEAYNDRTWNTEKINETIASLPGIIKTGVQEAFDAAVESGEVPEGGLDISVLYSQLAYTYNTSALAGGNVPDKEWSYGDASNFKTQYGTAEVWNQSPFQVSRTLKEMPAGTYTITTKGFFRNAGNAENLANAADPDYKPEASVFAGLNKTALVNIANLVSDTEIEGWENVDGVYVPNNQKAGYDIFNNDEYTDAVQKSVQTVLTEAGDLTFGVKASQMNGNSWVLWYSFEVKYNGAIDNDVLKAGLNEAVAEAEAYMNDNIDNMNAAGKTNAETAIEKAKEAASSSDTEEINAAINTAVNSIADMKANIEAMTAFNAAKDALDKAPEEEGAILTAKALAAYEAAQAKAGNIDEYATKDIIALIEEMKTAAALFRIPDTTGAADNNAIDMTCVIVNPDFENEEDGLKGWSYNKGKDTQAADNSNDTYHVENASNNKVFNTWTDNIPEGGLYVSQSLKALPAGTYEMTVLVASDKGNTINVSAQSNAEGAEAYGYAVETANDKNIGEDVTVIFQVKEGEDITIKVQSNTWFKADNFRLQYFGANSQKETTGVDGIEESADAEIAAIYNAAGAKVNALVKGVNIITYKNGTTKKVILK